MIFKPLSFFMEAVFLGLANFKQELQAGHLFYLPENLLPLW